MSEQVAIETITLERLRRLRAELDAADARASLARERWRNELAHACRQAGVSGEVSVDLARGVFEYSPQLGSSGTEDRDANRQR